MKRLKPMLICAVIFALGAVAQAQTTLQASLKRAETRDDSALPYRQAIVTISSDISAPGHEKVIRAITIRSTRGGPTMLINVTIPPKSPPRDISVLVPAMSAADSYTVKLLSGQTAQSSLIAQFDLSLDWPAEWVTAQNFLDPDAYDEGDYLPPVWSKQILHMVIAISAIACVMLTASLLVRPVLRRMFAAAVTAVIAGVSLWTAMSGELVVTQLTIGDDERLLLVSSRRTVDYEITAPFSIPLYYNLDEMASDNTTLHTPEKLLINLRPGEVRLFGKPSPPSNDQGSE
ncbi:MAG: hypothetical protein HN350_12885 [Phycisphaerales bacterium]|jgi:hypothetical protein|nr:hypothetical protein [Phycisphaerales bacterium]